MLGAPGKKVHEVPSGYCGRTEERGPQWRKQAPWLGPSRAAGASQMRVPALRGEGAPAGGVGAGPGGRGRRRGAKALRLGRAANARGLPELKGEGAEVAGEEAERLVLLHPGAASPKSAPGPANGDACGHEELRNPGAQTRHQVLGRVPEYLDALPHSPPHLASLAPAPQNTHVTWHTH